MFVKQDFPARKLCLDNVITSLCYLSFGLVENGTKILNLHFFVMTIYCFYYRTLSRKCYLSHTVVNKNLKKTQNPSVARR